MATRLATKKDMAGWGVVFPEYPLQRGVALVEDKWREHVLSRAKASGFVGKPLPGVGRDYHYQGELYRFTRKDDSAQHKRMRKFLVGYSAKWNFNGIMKVEAQDAAEAERRAQAMLDARADAGEFDNVSAFKAELDSVDVLDSEDMGEA